MQGYLFRFLTSQDATFQHIAVWTLAQLLESEGVYIQPGIVKDAGYYDRHYLTRQFNSIGISKLAPPILYLASFNIPGCTSLSSQSRKLRIIQLTQ